MAGTTIGRADWEVRADQTGLVKDLADAEGKVAATGKRVEKSATGTGLAFKAAAATAAGGFALMTAGALDMERAQGEFQAATGRSREEAIAFSKDMNGLVGTAATVGMSFEDITAAGIAVSQQFGVTGEEATELTGDILAFAKVTGQDAEQAAFQLEDTLSAFNLTADEAAGLMDTLVASNQKFGTDAGPATLSVLQGMAPALQAMGMEMDDGVELLNAFEVAGLDAGSAQRALQTAVQELKPGQNLDDLIAQVGAIEDPALRAQKAIELFGARAGVGLAQVIKPGMTSLDEFGISADEAAGKTDQAAEDMLTTSDKIKMFVEKVGSSIRGLGQDLGPMLSGAGGLVSVIAALPDKLTAPLVDAFKRTWEKVAASPVVQVASKAAGVAASGAYSLGVKVADALTGVLSLAWGGVKAGTEAAIKFAGAAAGAVYSAASAGVDLMMDFLKSAWQAVAARSGAAAALGKAVAYAGGIAGAVYSAAAATVDLFLDALKLVWVAAGSPGSSVMKSAAAAGMSAGSAFGAAAVVGAATAGFAVGAALLQESYNKLKEFLGPSGGPQLFEAAYGTYRNAGQGLGEVSAEGFDQGLETFGPPPPPATVLGPPAPWQQAGGELGGAAGTGAVDAFTQGKPIDPSLLPYLGSKEAWRAAGGGRGTTAGDALTKALADAATAGSATQYLRSAIDGLKTSMQNWLSPNQRALDAIGRNYIKITTQGLQHQEPEFRTAAQNIALHAISDIEAAGLKGGKGQKGLKAVGIYFDQLLASGMTANEIVARLAGIGVSEETIAGLKARYPQLFTTGQGMSDKVHGGTTSRPWYNWGHSIGGTWADGAAAAIRASINSGSLNNAINRVGGFTKGASPPKMGPLKDIDKGGYKVGKAWADALAKGMTGNLAGALGHVGRMLSPAYSPSLNLAGVGAGGGGSSRVVNIGGITINAPSGDAPSIKTAVIDGLAEVLDAAERGAHLRWPG